MESSVSGYYILWGCILWTQILGVSNRSFHHHDFPVHAGHSGFRDVTLRRCRLKTAEGRIVLTDVSPPISLVQDSGDIFVS